MHSHTENMPRDQVVWNAVFAALFLLVFAFFFWGLTDGLDQFAWLHLINTFDIVIISLATFRVIRLVTYDKMAAFVRDWFFDRTENGSLAKPSGGPRRTIAELLECMWCTGLWAALVVSVLYFAAGAGAFFVIVLAVAAVGSFLQNISAMIARIGK